MPALASPNIDEDDIAAVVRVLRSGRLVQGEEVAALEKEIAGFLDIPHGVAVTNGTAALHLALLAIGIGPGDEVIVPSFSFIATANAVEHTGARPVFADIDDRTFNLDPDKIVPAVSPRTKAVVGVHEFGLPCDTGKITAVCTAHGLRLVEDAACALGSKRGGRMAGTVGECGTFSLHPRKAITSGEGGIVVTRDPELAHRVRRWRNHGIEMPDGRMEFTVAGFNCRMTEMQAALVRGQLARLSGFLSRRQAVAARFLAEIRNPRVTLPHVPPDVEMNWQTFHLLLDTNPGRDAVMAALRARGIGCNLGAQCLPAQSFYRTKYGGDAARDYPNGWAAWQRGLAIPCHEKLTDAEVTEIIEALNAQS